MDWTGLHSTTNVPAVLGRQKWVTRVVENDDSTSATAQDHRSSMAQATSRQLGCWQCWDSRQPDRPAREKLDRQRRQCRENRAVAAAASTQRPTQGLGTVKCVGRGGRGRESERRVAAKRVFGSGAG